MNAQARIAEALAGRNVRAHACSRCGCTAWHLAESGECICTNCGTVPVTIAVVPVISPVKFERVC